MMSTDALPALAKALRRSARRRRDVPHGIVEEIAKNAAAYAAAPSHTLAQFAIAKIDSLATMMEKQYAE
jgi:hypothetical protein